ncbi:helix-turn-helix transcriptional regulator [Nonomuraea sp. NPDC050202]|uniref:helix-turn-helix domain-containing protein n=1 Tax=Nonomuraea sp. NPDC050202 TaxID=3155035 RepID=UPI0033CBB4E2
MPGKQHTEWAVSYTHQVADNIRHYRSRRRLSVQKLADRCTAMGYPIDRTSLTNLELGRRNLLSVPELLVVARALQVPPLTLLTPPTSDERVEILPGVETDPQEAFAWLDGTAPLPGDPDDDGAGPRAALRLLREHQKLLADWTARTRAAAAAQARAEDDAEQHRDAWKTAAHGHTERAGHAEQLLAQLRDTMRARDITLPPLPPELIHLDHRPDG